MATVEKVLFGSPWIAYNNKFIQSRITLTYPENVIFAAQLFRQVGMSDVYRSHPFSEKPDGAALSTVNWERAIIVFDSDQNVILAPDAVHDLVRLDRRLHYKAAEDAIFGFFRHGLFRYGIFRYQWVGLLLILLAWGVKSLVLRYKSHSMVLASTSSNAPGASGPGTRGPRRS